MKNNKLTIIATIIVFGISSFGCKKYLDVNKNPNQAAQVTVDLLLPSAEANIATVVGYNFSVFGGFWAQYWTQSPNSSQYRTIDQYIPVASDFDNPWQNIYTGALQNLNNIESQATAQQKYAYRGVARLLKAYTYQVMTDNFGDIPYSQALKISQGITNPKYDKQQVIYDSIIALAKAGIADVQTAQGLPGNDDLIYGGDVTKWAAFGNTLLLKMYLRLSDVNASKAQAGITALAGATFITDGQTAKVAFTTTGGNQNPFYAVAAGPVLAKVQNVYASKTIVDTMNAYGPQGGYDLRMDAMFYSAAAYQGIPQGGFDTYTSTGIAIPSAFVGANSGDANSATAPVVFMSDYESYFLQAEAMARGWMSGTAATAYAGGIQASFNFCNPYTISTYAEEIDTLAPYYLAVKPFPTSGLTAQLQAIALQKWIAMCGIQNCEAWIELRRFDYPKLPISLAANGFTKLPGRFFYPNVELVYNLNFPGQPLITDKVWWDIH
jgi:hypothetical protein